MSDRTPRISILLPTRGRTEQLDRSISSLIDLASDARSIQWLFGFDKDDTDSYRYCQEHILPKIDQSGGKYTVLGFDPIGYERLNEYVNALADKAQGEWFVFWNDDAVMLDQGWDDVIYSHTGKFVLQAFDTHNKHPYSIFPIVPRKWYEVIGHLSKHQLNDAWLSQIAWMLGIMLRIDVKVEHDRFDLTGKNFDDTFKQRKIFEGNVKDPRDFNYVVNRQIRVGEARTLARWLEGQGQDMSRWRAIEAGKQDPWDLMLASDVNGQMTRLPPYNTKQ